MISAAKYYQTHDSTSCNPSCSRMNMSGCVISNNDDEIANRRPEQFQRRHNHYGIIKFDFNAFKLLVKPDSKQTGTN